MVARLGAVLLALLVVAPGCARTGRGPGGEVRIVTGLYPFEAIARRVGGTRVEVTNVARPGAEPHDVELTPSQVGDVEQADLVLYVRGLQPALDSAVKDNGFDALRIAGGTDPHVWLDPVLVVQITNAFVDRLTALDKNGKDDYRANADAFVREVTYVHDQATQAFARCPRKDVVTSHAAFGRFASRYGLRQTAITTDPDAEPSPKRIAEMVAFVRNNGVTRVFAETGEDKTAQTVAREAGVQASVLDPAEIDRGEAFVDVLRRNVTTLHAALGCP